VVLVSFTTVGKKVKYKGKRGNLKGEVKKEVFAENTEGHQQFLNLIHYIKFEGDCYGIRFCYYKKRKGKWIFANRAMSIDCQTLKKLLRKASKESWFPNS
jgi:hypothetical protein